MRPVVLLGVFALVVMPGCTRFAGVADEAVEAMRAVKSTIFKKSPEAAKNGRLAGPRAIAGKLDAHRVAGAYAVIFSNTLEVGRFGDSITAMRLTARGWSKMPSKIDEVHGIDGVYKMDLPAGQREILIVENKVNSARLAEGQMSEEWIAGHLKRLDESGKSGLQRTAAEIKQCRVQANCTVRAELHHHDLELGVTTVRQLSREGRPLGVAHRHEDSLIENVVRYRCELGTLACRR